MAIGTIIGFRGIGNSLWSAGIDTLVDQMTGLFGWQGKTFNHYEWRQAMDWLRDNGTGPLVLIGHSMGVDAADKFAGAHDGPVAAVFSVASAYRETLPPNVNLVYQITASGDLRQFTVDGGKVRKGIVISGESHTSVDDSQKLYQIVRDEMHKIAAPKEAPMPAPVPVKGSLFNTWTPVFMKLLMEDFVLDVLDAAAICGNGGHESGGFETLQEENPMISGSRGGWGIMQWTGPRRKAFEAYCERNGYDPADMTANYKWLFVELKGPEGKVLPRLKAAKGLYEKTRLFSDVFLRPGIPHMASRYKWAEKALKTWEDAQARLPVTHEPSEPVPAPVEPVLGPVAGDIDLLPSDITPEMIDSLSVDQIMTAIGEIRNTDKLLLDGLKRRIEQLATIPALPDIPAANPAANTAKEKSMTWDFLKFESKTFWVGAVMVIAGILQLILPATNPIVALAIQFFGNVDPGMLITNGFAIIFGREAIDKAGKS